MIRTHARADAKQLSHRSCSSLTIDSGHLTSSYTCRLSGKDISERQIGSGAQFELVLWTAEMSDSEEEYAYSEDDEEERWYNAQGTALAAKPVAHYGGHKQKVAKGEFMKMNKNCLLYTSDAADE